MLLLWEAAELQGRVSRAGLKVRRAQHQELQPSRLGREVPHSPNLFALSPSSGPLVKFGAQPLQRCQGGSLHSLQTGLGCISKAPMVCFVRKIPPMCYYKHLARSGTAPVTLGGAR